MNGRADKVASVFVVADSRAVFADINLSWANWLVEDVRLAASSDAECAHERAAVRRLVNAEVCTSLLPVGSEVSKVFIKSTFVE